MSNSQQKLISQFHTKEVSFFTSIDGTEMVEFFDVNRFKYEVRAVIELAAEILAYKRMLKLLRKEVQS